MFNPEVFTLNLITGNVAEVITCENVFAYVAFDNTGNAQVKFPEGITHEKFETNGAALNEIARIWFLILDAEELSKKRIEVHK
ncbi:hypothetical protein FH968_02110 [Buttiauxella sp. B2]|uniref:hypothetical protein n=1 Tax=Buttiauxella sp. B2 TaxID=2587812 RepID=UPI00111EFAAA|nr:hypothetical protein [Buttiauxella sp. B2]TNV22858.1 hypothetical protein FH968_02110 [Buttiauxella sp. B2]